MSKSIRVNSKETFIEKAKYVHGDTYGYENVKYEGSKKKVIINCFIHGDFNQQPSNHLSGKGCNECGKIRAIEKKRKFSDELIEQIQGQWLGENLSCEEIAIECDVSDSAIHYHIKKVKKFRIRNFKNKSTRSNEYAFHKINEISAYWIGMLMADGCISSTEKNKESRVILVLHRNDEMEIAKFKDWLHYTGKTTFGEKKDKITGIITPYARVSISSDIMANELRKYGVVEQKSHVAKIKRLETDPNMWRGAICGDGHIGMNGKYPVLEFSGSEVMCHQFKKFCKKFISNSVNVNRDKTIYRYRLKGRGAVKIMKVLFNHSNYGLYRKVNLAKKIINKFN